jgi:broad specificity phosphatase PhoE
MDEKLPSIYLARHGETAWSLTGQHTGLSDIPLTARGERNAVRLGARLRGRTFAAVLSSPLQRARRTCELVGFGAAVRADADLVEWNYGDYEGLRTAEIHQRDPGWNVFKDGGPHGESVADVCARADRVVARVRAIDGCVLIFSSGHFLRALAARWVGLPVASGQYFALDTAALSIVGYEHGRDRPALCLWNDTGHVGE